MDAILCGSESFMNTAKMAKEVQRVLKTGGIYMVISYGSPENRIFHLVFPLINCEEKRTPYVRHRVLRVMLQTQRRRVWLRHANCNFQSYLRSTTVTSASSKMALTKSAKKTGQW
jgi:ubiquinone/menaquinone biosynthesis C-methylase UbiE